MMMWFWIVLLLGVVLFFLWRSLGCQDESSEEKRLRNEREHQNITIFKDRLSELQQDLDLGVLTQADFDGLSSELKKNLLRDIGSKSSVLTASQAEPVSVLTTKKWALIVCVAISVGAGSFYVLTSQYEQVQQWLSLKDKLKPVLQEVIEKPSKLADLGKGLDTRDFILTLQHELQTQPSSWKAWSLLAGLYDQLGAKPQATMASRKALMLAQGASEQRELTRELALQFIQSSLKENKGKLNTTSELALQEILSHDPDDFAALTLQGMGYFEMGEYAKSITSLERLLSSLGTQPSASPDVADAIQARIQQAKSRLTLMKVQSDSAKSSAEAAKVVDTKGAVTVKVSLSESASMVSFVQSLPSTAALFIFAKAVDGPPFPLAVKRLSLEKWPVEVVITDQDAMMPQVTLSNFEQVVISAKLSFSGKAMGADSDKDIKVSSNPLNPHQQTRVDLVLSIDS